MRALAWLWLAALGAIVFLPGCPPAKEAQSPVAAVVAVTANEVYPQIKEAYIQAGLDAVDQASSEEQAREDAAAVRRAWEPVWAAWDAFARAHDAWRLSLQGRDTEAILTAASAAREAYCDLLRSTTLGLPQMPGFACSMGAP